MAVRPIQKIFTTSQLEIRRELFGVFKARRNDILTLEKTLQAKKAFLSVAAKIRAPGGNPALLQVAKQLNQAGTRMFSLIEKDLAGKLGDGRLSDRPGKGLQPDFVVIDEGGNLTPAELKAIDVRADSFDSTTGSFENLRFGGAAKGFDLGGQTVTGSRQQIATGLTRRKDNRGRDIFGFEDTEVDSGPFLNALRAAKGDPLKIIKAFEQNDPAAQAFKTNLNLKSQTIDIPIDVGGQTRVTRIFYNFNTIKKLVAQKKIKIEAKETKSGINIRFFFLRSTILESLRSADKSLTRELRDGPTGALILKQLADAFALVSPAEIAELKKIFKATGFEVAISFLPGSAIVARGSVLRAKKKVTSAQEPMQRAISSVQLTALIQRRLAQIMPRGPERGPPLSPNILTERTGRFRKSVLAQIVGGRNNLIRFTYDPIYETFIDTARNPDRFVGKAIREVALPILGRRFQIVKQ